MGNSFEEWGGQEIESDIKEDEVFLEEKVPRFVKLEKKDEIREERILQDMEDSYQRLEKVLTIFNRM